MADSKILSQEEVDALSKVTQEKSGDMGGLVTADSTHSSWSQNANQLDRKAFKDIIELSWSECEKMLSSFLRKKITVKSKSASFVKLADYLQNKTEKYVFSVFKNTPGSQFSLVIADHALLHYTITTLFGGQILSKDAEIEPPGKVGMICAEKICQLGMESFILACKDYGLITYETIKTVTLPNLITKLNMDDQVCAMEMSVFFGELEGTLTVVLAENFLLEFLPVNKQVTEQIDAGSWRSTIEHQVADSLVTVQVSLPEVKIRASELMDLKNGDVIPISDPTLVYVSLNDIKLFTGNAGQANSNRVVKIISEV